MFYSYYLCPNDNRARQRDCQQYLGGTLSGSGRFSLVASLSCLNCCRACLWSRCCLPDARLPQVYDFMESSIKIMSGKLHGDRFVFTRDDPDKYKYGFMQVMPVSRVDSGSGEMYSSSFCSAAAAFASESPIRRLRAL